MDGARGGAARRRDGDVADHEQLRTTAVGTPWRTTRRRGRDVVVVGEGLPTRSWGQRPGSGQVEQLVGRVHEPAQAGRERVGADGVVGGKAQGCEPLRMVEEVVQCVAHAVHGSGHEVLAGTVRLAVRGRLGEHHCAAQGRLGEAQPLEVRLVALVDVEQDPGRREERALVLTRHEPPRGARVRCGVVAEDEMAAMPSECGRHPAERVEASCLEVAHEHHVGSVGLALGTKAVPVCGIPERKVLGRHTGRAEGADGALAEVEQPADAATDLGVAVEVDRPRLLRADPDGARRAAVIGQPLVALDGDPLVGREEHVHVVRAGTVAVGILQQVGLHAHRPQLRHHHVRQLGEERVLERRQQDLDAGDARGAVIGLPVLLASVAS